MVINQLYQQQFIFLFDNPMQNMLQFGQFGLYYYPIWIDPQLQQRQNSYFSPVSFYPQYLPPVINHIPTNTSIDQKTTKKVEESIELKEKQDHKQESVEVQQIVEISKKTVLSQQTQKEKKIKDVDSAKAKRPQTYETQKSYYMKQKIKGKMKCNYRILRKRNLESPGTCIKSKLRTTSIKITKEDKKTMKKKHAVAKDQLKEQKCLKKLKQKIVKDYSDGLAQIPPLVFGIKQLNQFVRTKLEGLKLRQLIKK